MFGLMMDVPLSITSIMRFAERNFPDQTIVSVTADNPRHRYCYADAFARTRRLAGALQALGAAAGDQVATLAWNDYRHFELYYATACSGLVCHTVNPRLFPDQIVYILNHAASRWVFTDPAFVPLLEQLQDRLDAVDGFVVLTDQTHMPATALRNVRCYEALLAEQPDRFEWPELDERTASGLCYTSGTTGHPKGVLYSHRSTVLHSYAISLPDVMGLSASDVILPVVPMFHVNAWGIPFAAPMTGAGLVFPGPRLADGEALQTLIADEGVSYTAGVPTVWFMLLDYLQLSGKDLAGLQRMIVGGAACPESLITAFRERYGVTVHQGWGMTETSPVGTYNTLKPGMERLAPEQQLPIRAKQGRGLFGIEMKITDDDDRELPWDGSARGQLKVRGPWVCNGYFGDEGATGAHDADGWFATGDVATIDSDGFMQIVDRTKDIIKSGGEWISSVTLENIAVGHPAVAEAAVIGRAHPIWGERPLLLVVPRADTGVDADELLAWFEGRVARWWLPDEVVIVAELPHTATGKLNKRVLRQQFVDRQPPAA